MAYSQYTLDSLTTELSLLMGDTGNVYWSTDEIQRAIKEGMLFWGALSLYWRQGAQFTTTSGTAFYDLATQISSLRSRSFTFGDLTRECQYHLLEASNGTSGVGMTDQFSISDITTAIGRNRNKLMQDTKMPLTYTQGGLNTVPTPDGYSVLDQTVGLVERASWQDSTSSIVTRLFRVDSWQADYMTPAWSTSPSLPVNYSMTEDGPLGFQFIPPPANSGQLNLIYTKTTTLTVADGTGMQTPDEYVHAIKWITLYDLLNTYDPGFDPIRAKYCLERYKQITDLAVEQKSIFRVLVNGNQVPLEVIYNLDSMNAYWENQSGEPTIAATAFDLVALSPVPDATYSVMAEVVRTAPLPVSGGDAIQMGKEEISYLIDYCRHILSFKMGGAEFVATMPLYDNFLRGAAMRNKLLATKARWMTPLFGAAQKESYVSPAA